MKRKWSKLTKTLIGITIGTAAVGSLFLVAFFTKLPFLGISPVIISDISIIGFLATICTGIFTGVRAIVRTTGRSNSKKNELKNITTLDKIQEAETNQTLLETKLTTETYAIKYADARLKQVALNEIPATGRRFFFSGSDKLNIYKNHLEGLETAKQIYTQVGQKSKLSYVDKQISKYQKLVEQEQKQSAPISLKYNWTRVVNEPFNTTEIKDHRSEISCMKSSTLLAYKDLARTCAPSSEYGCAVRLVPNRESSYLSPYASLYDEKRMEEVESLLCKEVSAMCKESKWQEKAFPVTLERIDLKTLKSTKISFNTEKDLDSHIKTLTDYVSTDSKYSTKKSLTGYLTRKYNLEKEEESKDTTETVNEPVDENVEKPTDEGINR